MVTSDQLYIVLSDILKELEENYMLPDVEQRAAVTHWQDEFGSILRDADFNFAARHFGKSFLKEMGANQDSKFTVNYYGDFLLVYKVEFPEGYLCKNLKNALIESLRSDVIDFEYENFLHCNILKRSAFSEFLKEIHSWIEPFDYPWYGTEKFYEELSGMDSQDAAVVRLCGKGHFDDTPHDVVVVGNTVIVARHYSSTDMTISWNRQF